MILVQHFSLLSKICWVSSVFQVASFQLERGPTSYVLKICYKDGASCISTKKLWSRYCIYLSFVILVITQYFLIDSVSTIDTLLFWFAIIPLAAGLCYIYVNQTKATEIVLYINSIFQFHSIYGDGNQQESLSLQARMALLFVRLILPTPFVVPIVCVYFLHWMNPCKASLLGYWLLRECLENEKNEQPHSFTKIVDTILKIILFLLNHLMWAFGIHGIPFGMLVMNTISIICLQQLVDR